MNFTTRITNPFIFLALTLILSVTGCAGAIDSVVDSHVSKMVEEENQKLPRDVGHGMKLVRIDYDEAANKLTMNYSVPNQREFESNFTRVKNEINDRIANDDSLETAFEHGVRLHHQFFTNEQASGIAFQTFESAVPK